MKKAYVFLVLFLQFGTISIGQDYGNFPKIEKQKLLNDLELLYQGLDKFHSGMYWYTSKESVDSAFDKVKNEIDRDMNVLEFYKLTAPLVSLSSEGHSYISLPDTVYSQAMKENKFLPLVVVFLEEKLYCYANGSNHNDSLMGLEIESINGEKPLEIAKKLGLFLTSDGYIHSAKRHYLRGFRFSRKYYFHYGKLDSFKVKFKNVEVPLTIEALTIKEINENLNKKFSDKKPVTKKELLDFKILNDSTAYLGIHSFSNDELNKQYEKGFYKSFLENSFQSISEHNIQNLIIDVGQNGGGNEGNDNLLYSYIGENFKKYDKVRAKTNKAILDNGVDAPITLKIFGPLERLFVNKKMKDGSFERNQWPGFGLMAFKKKPKNAFKGELYVIIGPKTYSGGSEFSNLVYTQELATFVGQETGGGYYGNTSGYTQTLILPNSKLKVGIPALQFVLNVNPTLPFGNGVIPHYEVIPTFEQLIEGRNMPLEFILNKIAGQE